MSWLSQRWRTQRNAIRDANCRASESSNLWTHIALSAFGREYSCLSVCLCVFCRASCFFFEESGVLQKTVGWAMCCVCFVTAGRWWDSPERWDCIAFLQRRFLSKIASVWKAKRNQTSNQERIPPEFKHITKGRKRN